jgi:hypothetical protein
LLLELGLGLLFTMHQILPMYPSLLQFSLGKWQRFAMEEKGADKGFYP